MCFKRKDCTSLNLLEGMEDSNIKGSYINRDTGHFLGHAVDAEDKILVKIYSRAASDLIQQVLFQLFMSIKKKKKKGCSCAVQLEYDDEYFLRYCI